MKRILVILLFTSLLFTGCSNNSTYNKYMEEGKMAIVNEEYEKAKDLFTLAAEEKKNDKEAKSLQSQITKLIEGLKLKDDGKYEEVISLCEEIDKLDSESNIIQSKAKELKKECETKLKEFEKNKEELDDKLDEVEELINNGNYNDAKSQLDNIIEEIDGKEIFSEELKTVEELLITCEKKIKEKEAEAEEAKNKSQKNSSESSSSKEFTGDDAINHAMKHYGEDGNGDTLFAYDTEPIYNQYGKCYRVVLKSKEMMDQGGTGTLFWVMVTENGYVIEDF